jgi:phosphatidylinositol/phosphatidylcholine transfer protein
MSSIDSDIPVDCKELALERSTALAAAAGANDGFGVGPTWSDAERVDLFSLDADQLSKLKELSDKCNDLKLDDPTLMRFLVARKYEVSAAEKQLRAHIAWRSSVGVSADSVLECLPPKSDIVRKLIPHSFYGYDKEGHPLYIERTGEVDVPLLINLVTDKENLQNHIYGFEHQLRRMRVQTKKLNKPISSAVQISDLTGFGVRHAKGLSLLKHFIEIDAANYPETLSKAFVINAPWYYSVMWKIIRPLVDPVTRQKVHVLGSNFKEVLLQHIDADQLPIEYGGSANIRVPHYEGKVMNAEDFDPELKEENVAAGTRMEKQIKIGWHGGSVSWFFRTQSKDIKFSVEWIPDEPAAAAGTGTGTGTSDDSKDIVSTGAHRHFIVEPIKVDSSKTRVQGSEDFNCPGTIVIIWDNSYSYFTSKTIRYNVGVVQYDDQDDDEQAAD